LLWLAMPGAAPAQQPGKTPRIGVLVWWSAGTAVAERTIGPFREGLRELGYIEGQTLLIEWRFGDERGDRAATLATELVGLGVDLIVAIPGPAGLAAQSATRTVPIVVIAAGDPVGMGLVKSLARPGGNVTGTSFNMTEGHRETPGAAAGAASTPESSGVPDVRGGFERPPARIEERGAAAQATDSGRDRGEPGRAVGRLLGHQQG